MTEFQNHEGFEAGVYFESNLFGLKFVLSTNLFILNAGENEEWPKRVQNGQQQGMVI